MKVNRTGGTNIDKICDSKSELEELFDRVVLIDPINKTESLIEDYHIKNTNVDCRKNCPLAKDINGCICKEVISSNDKRVRIIYNREVAHLVIGRKERIKYNDYVMLMIMKLNPQFMFGGTSETEAIESISKISSNIVRDALTGLLNRKYIMDNIEYMIMKSQNENTPLSLACIDIDNFKQFNDKYGHDFGDRVLISVAANMVKSTKGLEEVYNIRIGGDEFIIVGAGVHKKRFKLAMENLVQMVENTKLDYEKQKVGIRISVGVSELLSDKVKSYKELYDLADSRLYEAKEAGKGCVR